MLCRNGGKYRLTLCQIPSTASGVWKETANMLVEYESRVLPCVEKRLALSELHQWHQTGVYRTHWCRGVGPPGPAGFAPSAAVCLVHLGFTGSYRGRLEGTHGDSWPAGPWVWYLCTKPGQNFHLLLHKKAFFSAKTTSKHGFIDCRKVAPRGAGWSPPPGGCGLVMNPVSSCFHCWTFRKPSVWRERPTTVDLSDLILFTLRTLTLALIKTLLIPRDSILAHM